MTGGSTHSYVQRYWQNTSDSTVSCHVECQDGSRWRTLEIWEPMRATGAIHGEMHDGAVYYPIEAKP